MNLIDLAKNFSTEERAIAFLEARLWPDGPVCPHCGIVGEAFRMQSKAGSKNQMRPGLWKCSECRKTFRATVGTIFEDSHIPLHKWMVAIHLMSASKKGMSAHQLHRMLGLGYRAAWFMAHRIRYAMRKESQPRKLSGTVEADETWVGGKVIGQGVFKGKAHKTPVVSLVERKGDVRSFHVDRVTAKNLRKVMRENISPDASLMTDEAITYATMSGYFKDHDVIRHCDKVYSRREGDKRIHTNTVEGFFSILKGGIVRTFHHVSKQHLHRYLLNFAK